MPLHPTPRRGLTRLRRLRAEPHVVLEPATGQTSAVLVPDLIDNALGAMHNSFSAVVCDVPGLHRSAPEPAVLGEQLALLHRELGLITKRGSRATGTVPEGGTTVFCTDTENPDSLAAWSAAAAASEAQFGHFGRLWTWVSSPCGLAGRCPGSLPGSLQCRDAESRARRR